MPWRFLYYSFVRFELFRRVSNYYFEFFYCRKRERKNYSTESGGKIGAAIGRKYDIFFTL